MVEGDPVRTAHGLRLLPGERARLRDGDREAPRHRGAAEGDLDADAARRAEPHPLAPRLARNVRARAGRDLPLLVRVPRARPRARPLRARGRRTNAHAVLPGRRPRRGHPARLLPAVPRVLRGDAEGGRRVRVDAHREPDLAGADEGRRAPLRRGRDRARPVGPGGPRLRASTGTCARPRRTSRTPTSTSTSPSRRTGTCTTATRSTWTRCASRCASSNRPSKACRPARGSPTTARSCCRRGRSCTPRWSRSSTTSRS